jgi:ribosomal protein S18 acetylase RimI-like enzyme
MLSPARSRRETSRVSANLSIRAGRDEDEAFAIDLARDAFLYLGSYDRYVGDWFRDPAVHTYVVLTDETRCGFFMLTTYPDPDRPGIDVADLVAIVVSPEYRSRGVGQLLLDRALALALALRPAPEEMWLVVAEGNARAERLFAGRGFRRGSGVGVYPSGRRALRMLKSLSSPKKEKP